MFWVRSWLRTRVAILLYLPNHPRSIPFKKHRPGPPRTPTGSTPSAGASSSPPFSPRLRRGRPCTSPATLSPRALGPGPAGGTTSRRTWPTTRRTGASASAAGRRCWRVGRCVRVNVCMYVCMGWSGFNMFFRRIRHTKHELITPIKTGRHRPLPAGHPPGLRQGRHRPPDPRPRRHDALHPNHHPFRPCCCCCCWCEQQRQRDHVFGPGPRRSSLGLGGCRGAVRDVMD